MQLAHVGQVAQGVPLGGGAADKVVILAARQIVAGGAEIDSKPAHIGKHAPVYGDIAAAGKAFIRCNGKALRAKVELGKRADGNGVGRLRVYPGRLAAVPRRPDATAQDGVVRVRVEAVEQRLQIAAFHHLVVVDKAQPGVFSARNGRVERVGFSRLGFFQPAQVQAALVMLAAKLCQRRERVILAMVGDDDDINGLVALIAAVIQ